jgi:hypothetical protein
MRLPALAGILLAIAALALVRRQVDAVEVRGRSMAPTLLPGDRLLVLRARPRVGDVALAPDPRRPARELIKRVAAVGPNGVALRGDNAAASTDATVPPPSVQWRAILRYWPPSRATARLERPERLSPIDQGGEPACAFPEAIVAG